MKALLLSLIMLVAALPAPAAVSFVRYLETTAGEGEAESLLVLGLAYRDGWDGAIKPDTFVARWCGLAAEQQDRRPAFVLTLLLRDKAPIARDPAKALQFLNAAAKQGDNYARVLLGEMLLEGNGVPADWHRGSEWIMQAARAGFASAQFRLGILYLVGDAAMPKNEIEALAWFIVAADAGSKPAQKFRDERTETLGKEAAQAAVKLSRRLLAKDPSAGSGG